MTGYEVKIIEAHTKEEFELALKNWKNDHPHQEIIDIKYSVVSLKEDHYLYSGLISFKERHCY